MQGSSSLKVLDILRKTRSIFRDRKESNVIQRLLKGEKRIWSLSSFGHALNGKIFMRKDNDFPVHFIANKEDLQKMQSR